MDKRVAVLWMVVLFPCFPILCSESPDGQEDREMLEVPLDVSGSDDDFADWEDFSDEDEDPCGRILVQEGLLYQIAQAQSLDRLVEIKTSAQQFFGVDIAHELQEKADQLIREAPTVLNFYFHKFLYTAEEERRSVNALWQALNCSRRPWEEDGECGLYQIINEKLALYEEHFFTIFDDVLSPIRAELRVKRGIIDHFVQDLKDVQSLMCHIAGRKAGIFQLGSPDAIAAERLQVMALVQECSQKLDGKEFVFGLRKGALRLGEWTLNALAIRARELE
ncbi:hypothetical protein ACFLX2_01490 [Candidatus Dependentiae bacterium]